MNLLPARNADTKVASIKLFSREGLTIVLMPREKTNHKPMKIQDEFSISLDGYHVRIDVEITPSMVPLSDGRPRWKIHYDELGKGGIEVMDTVRQELEELDEEDYLPVGTAGFAVGDLYLEHDQNKGLQVKNDKEELLGELSEEQLRDLVQEK